MNIAERLRARWRFVASAAEEPSGSAVERAMFSSPTVGLYSPWTSGGMWNPSGPAVLSQRVLRDEALQVPAMQRARNLIAGTISGLPLVTLDANRATVRVPLLEQIDPNVANVVTLAHTVEDLMFEGQAWWRVKLFGWDGYPSSAEYIPVTRVHVPLVGRVRIDGVEVDDSDVIRFDSPNPAVLVYAARAIRRALKFEQAAELYASTPKGLGYFTPDGDSDPADEESIAALLSDWDAGRWEYTTAYVPAALRYNSMSLMSPADLQLVELQSRAALDIANCTGLDPRDVGVPVNDRTYNNAQDRRQDRLNETLQPYMRAITDRLSMGDVTKRGQRVIFDLDDFMRADPMTRAQVQQIHKNMGTLTVDEIREEEGRPALSAAQKKELRPPAPTAPAVQPQPNDGAPQGDTPMPDAGNQMPDKKGGGMAAPANASFSRETGLHFDMDGLDAEFTVDENTRTITGLAVPYGVAASSGGQMWKFTRGSLKWADPQRVKLLRDHNMGQAIGRAIKLTDTETGLVASFKVARGAEGDQALSLAADGVLDGLSIGIDFAQDGIVEDPTDPYTNLVLSAALREVSLTAMPAFDDSRVTKVAATAPERDLKMTDAATGQTAPVAPAATAAIPAQPVAPVIETGAFTEAVQAFTAAVGRLGEMPAEQRQTVNPTRATVREPLVYSLSGQGASFVHDAWTARTEYGPQRDEAFARLRKYEAQTAELASSAAVRFANAGNITDQASIIPPGYRPDLYVGQIPQGRPLFESMSRGTIANATPFKVPVWVSGAGLSGTNSENTGPSTGTITDHTYRTVSPTAQSGEFVISRELVDAANPAIDMIALAAMREEYAQDTEAVIAAAIAAATDNDTGSGQSTEGCYVYSVVGDGLDLSSKVRAVEAAFPFHRYAAPNRVLLSSTGYGALVGAVDGVGRPLFPFTNGQNVLGTVSDGAQAISIDGLAGTPAWGLTAGTDDVVVFNSVDAWAWESPLLTFRFEEKAGPESIVLNLWGYFAFQILRYTGVHSVAYTGA